jgi:hypothetical protein
LYSGYQQRHLLSQIVPQPFCNRLLFSRQATSGPFAQTPGIRGLAAYLLEE